MTSFQWSVFHAKKHKSEFRRGFLIEFLNVNSASVINALQKIDIISQKRFTGTRGTLTCLVLIRMCILFKTWHLVRERKQGTVPFLERQKLKILPNPFWKKTSTTFQKCSDWIICNYLQSSRPIFEIGNVIGKFATKIKSDNYLKDIKELALFLILIYTAGCCIFMPELQWTYLQC
jgi:hypothetical protein